MKRILVAVLMVLASAAAQTISTEPPSRSDGRELGSPTQPRNAYLKDATVYGGLRVEGNQAISGDLLVKSINGMAVHSSPEAVGYTPGMHINGRTGEGPGHTRAQILLLDAASDPHQSTLAFWGVHRVTGSLGKRESQDGMAGEVQVYGKLEASTGNIVGVEGTATIQSSGHTIPTVYGLVGNVHTTNESTTGIKEAAAIRAQQITKHGTGSIATAYSLYLDAQDAGTANWSLFSQGNLLLANDQASLWANDARGTAHSLLWPTSTNNIELRPLDESKGWTFESQDRRSTYLRITNSKIFADVALSARSVSVNGGRELNYQTGSGAAIVTDTSPTIISPILSRPTVEAGVAAGGTGHKHLRSGKTCTTAATAGATCTTDSINWSGPAFSDTNYDMACTLAGRAKGVPVIVNVTKKPGSFTVTIAALTPSAAAFSEIDCVADHD